MSVTFTKQALIDRVSNRRRIVSCALTVCLVCDETVMPTALKRNGFERHPNHILTSLCCRRCVQLNQRLVTDLGL